MGIYVVMMKEEHGDGLYTWADISNLCAFNTEEKACSYIQDEAKRHNVEYLDQDFATYEDGGKHYTLYIDWCPLG